MVIGRLADGISQSIEGVSSGVSEALFEPVIRLGVTGLSRAGKTVFITSLVANLMDRGRMPQLLAARKGTIQAAWLQPQPDDTIARFDYETHLAALTGSDPAWPKGTERVSELRLSFKVQPSGIFGAIGGPRTVHLDIVDYPGEWLLDLALLDKSYEAWSAEVLARLPEWPEAAAYADMASQTDGAATLDESTAKALSASFTDYLHKARQLGFSDCTPGRFLLPGELEGSPVLTFAPLKRPEKTPRGSLWREFERRYKAYQRKVVKPFFRNHFSRIDRQIVLMDVLGAIHSGPKATEDMRRTMAEILQAFRPGRNAWLSRILGGKRVEKILFAATKADYLHHTQHDALAAITEAMLREARDRADFAGAKTAAMAIASYRATVEETVTHEGAQIELVRGRLASTNKETALYAGELPNDPGALLAPAREGNETWLDQDYAIMEFLPAKVALTPGEGPPHIRLDRAAEFLIGDRLR